MSPHGQPPPTKTLDRVAIEAMHVDCIIGINPEERDKPQPVRVDVAWNLPLAPAATSGRLDATVDYAAFATAVRERLVTGRFELLETAAHELCEMALAALPAAAAAGKGVEVAVTLRKPRALGPEDSGGGHGIPAVTLRRRPRG